MKNYKINSIFVGPEGPKGRSSKTGIDFIIFILLFVDNCVLDTIHDFSVCLSTVSNN